MTRTLLVASAGGHIDELYEIAPRIARIGPDRQWVTPETAQTTRLLSGEQTKWVNPISSRQGGRAVARLPQAFALIRRYRPDLAVSTGAALAAPYLLAASMLGVETHYIESATRLDGPSLTGRLAARMPHTRLHHQGFALPRRGWTDLGSVFDAYIPGPPVEPSISTVVVILGTERYPFPRALELIQTVIPPRIRLLVQTGRTPRPNSTDYRQWVPFDELTEAIAEADVVITHAGVGSVLTTLRAGKHPVLLPRSAERGEHVDNHQLELAKMLEDRKLVTVAMPDADLATLLERAAGRSTVRAGSRPVEI